MKVLGLILVFVLLSLFVVCGKKSCETPIIDENIVDFVRFKVTSNKTIYREDDNIQIIIEYEYVGNDEEITIYYGNPIIMCDLTSYDNDIEYLALSDLMLESKIIRKDEVEKFIYIPQFLTKVNNTADQTVTVDTFKLLEGKYNFKAYINFGYSQTENIESVLDIDFEVKD